MEELWRRVSQGQHVAVLGARWAKPLGADARGDAGPIAMPPPGAPLRVVRVSCDVPQTPLGPLLEARRKVDDMLGESGDLLDQAKERMMSGLRRRLLGEDPAVGIEGGFVQACNRLFRHSGRPHALFFDAVDAADVATITTLTRILGRPGWLCLPLVLVFRAAEPAGAAAELIDALRSVCGPESVIHYEMQVPPQTAPVLRWRELPPDVLEVLRVGAIIGSGFESELVASVLGLDPLRVLELLQIAFDRGVGVEDRGEGRFHLPDRYIRELSASILPSLSLAWHRRIAQTLSGSAREQAQPSGGEREAQPSARSAETVTMPPVQGPGGISPPDDGQEAAASSPVSPPAGPMTTPAVPRALGRSEPVAAVAEAPGQPQPEAEPSPWQYGDLFQGSLQTPEPALEQQQAPQPALDQQQVKAVERDAEPEPPATQNWMGASGTERPPVDTARSQSRGHSARARDAGRSEPTGAPDTYRPTVSSSRNDARAASHLDAAGDADAAAQRYYEASHQAAAVGAAPQALAYAQRALALVEGQPPTPARRRLRIGILSELGRLMWQAAGPEGSFTLTGALELLDAAKALLRDNDPADLVAQVSTLIASVCYDIGDAPSLDRALAELTHASRALLAQGNAVGAARLLNDQAAVYVRMGDPVRAVHLLGESRKVFEQRAKSDPVTMIELAETDHLLARIPLNVGARPGREADALSMGLDHALAAERNYKKLGATREVARVWETMARLELRRGRLENAMDRLSTAMRTQQTIGDVIGLARSTAAMAEVLAAGGRMRESITLLSDSMAFNLEKGSPIGLAYNRRALEALSTIATHKPDVKQAVSDLAHELSRAEAILGQIKLPGEAG